MITIKDVALHSGVSLTTVSRVINGSEKVTSKTKEKVNQAIQELGYFPNKAARSLVTKQGDSIAIIFRNLHDPFFGELISGMEDAALASGRNIIFCSPGKAEKVRDRYIEYLTNGISDGIIFYGSLFSDKTMIDHLYKVNFPFLLIENNFQTMPVNQFLIDNVNGAKDAVQYLIQRGHTRIAHVMGNPNKKVVLERFSGYTEAMLGNGLLIREDYIQKTQDDSTIAPVPFKKMMSAPVSVRPTAIFCSNDKLAIQAIHLLNESGFSVPDDVSVVGFDHLTSYNISYQGPRITSIKQPLYEIGYDSVLTIDQILKGEITEPVNKQYFTTLVEHDTVSDLRKEDS